MAKRTPVPPTKPNLLGALGMTQPTTTFAFGAPVQNPLTDLYGITTPKPSPKPTKPPPAPAAAPGKAASNDGNTVSNVGTDLMSVDTEDMLHTNLDRAQDFLPNFLNDFHNVTYHIRFFMIDPDSYSGGLTNIGNMAFSDVVNTIDSSSKVVIAESGVTAALNIKRMTFTSFRDGDDREKPTAFEMTIVEPLGTSFYDVTVNAANTLGIMHFDQSPYFIEITFKGYDENGMPVTNVLSGHQPTMDDGQPVPENSMFHNNGRWLYQVFLQQVTTQVTEEGSTHTLTFTPSEGGSAGQDLTTVPEAIVVTGLTVGEFLKDLKAQLEAVQLRRYGVKLYTYDFEFQPSPHVKGDPNSWSLLDDPHKFTDKANLDMKTVNGKPVMQIEPSADIQSVLMLMFANTKEAQRYAINGTKAEDQIVDGGAQSRDQIIMNITKSVNIGKTHYVWGYEKLVRYQIRPQFQNRVVLHPQQVEEAKQPTVQAEMVKKLHDYGYFRKRFDYYYTGMNTEVLKFDVKFDMFWAAVLPHVVGWQSARNQIQVNAKYNDNAVIQTHTLAQRLTEFNTAFGAASDALKNFVVTNKLGTSELDVRADGTLTSGQKVTAAQQAQLKKLADARNSVAADRAKAASSLASASQTPSSEQDASATQFGSNQTLYAEDLTEPVRTSPFGVRIVQAPAGKGDSTGSGMSEPYHRDRAVFGALMEQLQGSLSGVQLQIEMDIRGDPYWLGFGNMENPPSPQELPGLSPHEFGAVTFFLKIAYPFQASSMADNGEDENASSPNFRQTTLGDGTDTREDAFTGFYQVQSTTHTFEDGQFTQTLKAFRNPLLAAHALGYAGLDSDQWLSEYEKEHGGSGDGTDVGEGTTAPVDLPKNMDAAACVLYGKLSKMGYNDVQSAAIIGSWMQESSLNSGVTNTKGSTVASPGAFGLAQWYADRKSQLIAYARQRNLDPASTDAQLGFFEQEMSGSHASDGKSLKNATTLNEAMAAMNSYEAFRGYKLGPAGEEAGKRYGYAQSLLTKFQSGGCK